MEIQINNKEIVGDLNIQAYCLALNIDPLKVTSLNCSHNEIRNISGIACLKNLSKLSCEVNKIKNIKFLKFLPKIEYINLNGNKINSKKAMNIIKDLPNIKFFDIRGKNND